MKAVILEIRDGKAAVLAEDGTVVKIKTDRPVGATVEIPAVAHSGTPRLVRIAASAAAALMLVCSGGYYTVNAAPYAYVSVDVNPSIEYTINRRHQVIDIEAMNSDGQAIVAQIEERAGKKCSLTEAMEATAGVMRDAAYLDTDSEDYFLVNISTDHEGEKQRLEQEVEQFMVQMQDNTDSSISYLLSTSTKKEHREADRQGMSVGRYKSFEEAADGQNVEEYREKPVQEILSGAPDRVVTPEPARKADKSDLKNDPGQTEEQKGVREDQDLTDPATVDIFNTEAGADERQRQDGSQKDSGNRSGDANQQGEKNQKPASQTGGKNQQNAPQTDGKNQQSAPQNGGNSQQSVPQDNGKNQQSVPQDNGKNQQSAPQNGGNSQQSAPQDNGKNQQSAPQDNGKNQQSAPQDNGKNQQSAPQDNGNNQQSAPQDNGKNQQSAPQNGGNNQQPVPQNGGNNQQTAPQNDGNNQQAAPQNGGNNQQAAPRNGGNNQPSAPQTDGKSQKPMP